MAAKRVSSAKRLKEQAAADARLRLARTLVDNVLWACEHNQDTVQATKLEEWRTIFQRLREALR